MPDELTPVDPPVRGANLDAALSEYADRVYPMRGSSDTLRAVSVVGQEPAAGGTLVRFVASWDGANLDRDERDWSYSVLVRAIGGEYEIIAARAYPFGFG